MTHDHMMGMEMLPGFGKATNCQLYKLHRPAPLRFIWHHILPQTCGGQSVQDNLSQLCDSCHYAVHAMLYDLKVHQGAFISFSKYQKTPRAVLAYQGYEAAVAAGTVDKIPQEGSIE